MSEKIELSQIFTERLEGKPVVHAEAFSLDPQTFNEEDNTIKVRFTNNNKVIRYNYATGKYYYLQLSSSPEHVNLSRLNSGAAVVDSHDTGSLKSIIGSVVPGSATHKEATIKFSTREDVKPIVEDIKAGIIRFVSPGFFVHEMKDITKEDDEYQTLKVVNWEPYEISFVAVPADPQAQAFEALKQVGQTNEAGKNKEQENMLNDKTQESLASEPTNAIDIAKVKTEAKGEEKARIETIMSISEKSKLGLAFAQEMITSNKTIEEVSLAAFNKLAEKAETQEVSASNFSVTGGSTEMDKKNKAVQLAFESRVGLISRESGNEFNNSSLFEIAKFYAAKAGADIANMSKTQIVEFSMHSTSDFANILANTATKTLRKAYGEQERTFTPFCTKTTLRDFKPVDRNQLSEIPTPELVIEGGEFKQTTISDGKESYRLNTYGSIISITRQAIINDDLSAFTRVPTQLGAAMARLEGDIVYGILTGNPVMGDGQTLFHATHNNVTDALLLDNHATLNYYAQFVALFRKQKGPKGISNLNLYPNFLIVGPDSEVPAKRLLANVTPSTAGQVNPFSGSGQLIVENRLTGPTYYGAASPSLIDTIEYGYLEGEEGPQTFTRNGFGVDGVEIKTRLDFAAKAIDWRGLARSTNNDS